MAQWPAELPTCRMGAYWVFRSRFSGQRVHRPFGCEGSPDTLRRDGLLELLSPKKQPHRRKP